MSEIEEKLARILVAEADRHEVPRFDPYRIAENAGRRMSWYRKPLVMLAGVLVVGGGAYGVVVGAASGGHDSNPDKVTVTFQGQDSSTLPAIGGVEQQVLHRAALEGLKDVEVRFSEHPFTLAVTGRAADVEKLKTLGAPGIVQMRPVIPSPVQASAPTSCADMGNAPSMTVDGPGYACAKDGVGGGVYVGAPDPFSYRVGVAKPMQEIAVGGLSAGAWEVDMTFDAAGTRAFAALTDQAYHTGFPFAVCVDGVVYEMPIVQSPITDGNTRLIGTFTEQQAKALTAEIAYPLPLEFENAQVTVTPISTR